MRFLFCRSVPSLALLLLAMTACPTGLVAQLLPGDDGGVPGYPNVVGELIQVPGFDAPDTPPELDVVTFLRLRPRKVRADSTVDALVIAQPGFSSTPGMWLQTSAQMVAKAGERRCQGPNDDRRKCALEVWIVDRRGSHVEDTRGLMSAWLAEDPALAVDYYYGKDGFTDRGTIPLPPAGNYDKLLGNAKFEPLTQKDLAYAWDWGFETMAGDIDALLALAKASSNADAIFLAGHSQGGGFVSSYAGRAIPGSAEADTQVRGDDRLAGLIFLDGGPSIGQAAELSETATEAHLATVARLRAGEEPVFGASLAGLTLGTGLGVRSGIQGLYYLLAPDAESVMAPAVLSHPAALCFVQGYHLPKDLCDGKGLRLTNRAHAGFSFDDDPIPGTFLQTPVITMLGIRAGRLDFEPMPGTENLCAAEGPEGAKPPCPPDTRQIDPDKVYGWLDGGAKGKAGPDGEKSGWVFSNGQFNGRLANPGPNPSNSTAYMQQTGYAPRSTNLEPFELEFAESGRRVVDARILNGLTWYQSRRYDLDLRFLGGAQKIQIDQGGVRHDIDKTVLQSPVYVASRRDMKNPFPEVTDYTAIGREGTSQSEAARQLSPIDETIDSSLYGHTDFLAADDGAARGTPGQPGTNLVSNTLVGWIFARATGTVTVPTSESLGVHDWSDKGR